MTPSELQELKEKADLWDSLSEDLRKMYCNKFRYGTSTIENISNSSSHIKLLEEESKDTVKVDCWYCGRVHHSTMCKIHPAYCKNK